MPNSISKQCYISEEVVRRNSHAAQRSAQALGRAPNPKFALTKAPQTRLGRGKQRSALGGKNKARTTHAAATIYTLSEGIKRFIALHRIFGTGAPT